MVYLGIHNCVASAFESHDIYTVRALFLSLFPRILLALCFLTYIIIAPHSVFSVLYWESLFSRWKNSQFCFQLRFFPYICEWTHLQFERFFVQSTQKMRKKTKWKKNYMQFLSFRQHICQSLSIDFYQQLEILCSWCISIVAKVATNFHPPGQTKIHLCTHNSDSFFKEKKVFNCAHFLLFIA